MTSSFIVRLTWSHAPGRLVGHVEAVATGERVAIGSGEELVAYLTARLGDRSVGMPGPAAGATEGSDGGGAPVLHLDERRLSR